MFVFGEKFPLANLADSSTGPLVSSLLVIMVIKKMFIARKLKMLYFQRVFIPYLNEII